MSPVSGSMIFTSVCGIGLPSVSVLSIVVSCGEVIDATGEHSVWPNTMVNAAPVSFSIRSTRGAGTVDPPEQTASSDVMSRFGYSGCSSIEINMVGTASIAEPLYSSMSSNTNEGSKASSNTNVHFFETAESTPTTHPPV